MPDNDNDQDDLPEEAKKDLPDSGEILEVTDEIPGATHEEQGWNA